MNKTKDKFAKTMEKQFTVLLMDIMKEGGINITGFKNCGKTNAMQVLTSEAMKLPNVTVYIFDDCGNWRHYFNSIRFLEVTDDFVKETNEGIELGQDVFVRYERGYTVTHAEELSQIVKDKQHTLFDLSIKDIDRQGFFCYSIIQKIYDLQRIQKKHYGMNLPHSYLIVTEEMQNLWEMQSTNKRCFNRMRKIFSTARNFKISFMGSMQRLSDVSTKIIERQNYLFGKTIGDNDTLKVSRILRNHVEERKQLEKAKTGIFLYYNGFKAEMIKFPKFKQVGKPFLIKPKITEQPKAKPKPKGKLRQFIETLDTLLSGTPHVRQPQNTEVHGEGIEDIDKDEDDLTVTFEDEDLISEDLFGED